jgi:hypothetical protein
MAVPSVGGSAAEFIMMINIFLEDRSLTHCLVIQEIAGD